MRFLVPCSSTVLLCRALACNITKQMSEMNASSTTFYWPGLISTFGIEVLLLLPLTGKARYQLIFIFLFIFLEKRATWSGSHCLSFTIGLHVKPNPSPFLNPYISHPVRPCFVRLVQESYSTMIWSLPMIYHLQIWHSEVYSHIGWTSGKMTKKHRLTAHRLKALLWQHVVTIVVPGIAMWGKTS